MRRLFSRIKLEPRASVALFKNTDGQQSTTLFDQLQGMINEHDKQEENSTTANGSTKSSKRKKNSTRSSTTSSLNNSCTDSNLSASVGINVGLSKILNKSVWGHDFPSNSPQDIPQFLFSAMEYLEKHGLDTEGIFRHSTSKSREEKVMKEIDELFISGGAKMATVDFYEYSDVHLAASLIKLYLRKLKEPLLTNKLYESFLATSKMINTTSAITDTSNMSAAEIEQLENNRKCQLLQQICGLLPRANYLLLKKLCLFLNSVSKKQQVNLMSPENIAIVIQPNILYLKDQDPMLTIRDISNATNVIKSLIVLSSQIFEDDCVTDAQTSDENTANSQTCNDQTEDDDLNSANINSIRESRVYHKRQVSVKMVLDVDNNLCSVTSLESESSIDIATIPHNHSSNSLGDQNVIDCKPFYKGDTNTNGQKHGFGILMYNDGGVYEGYFLDDMRDGSGKMVFIDGSKYEGEFSKDSITGKGVYKYASGDVYDGHFVNSIKSGRGKMKFAANQSHYDGEWNNDKREGFGKQSYPNADMYEGEWLGDFSHGYGTFTSTGYTYVGYWKRGKFDGKGRFVLLDSKESLEGSWVDGQIEGETHYTDAQGRKFAQLYEKGELIKNEQVIDEHEKKVLDLLAKLMEEPIKSHPSISSFLNQQLELINKVVDVNDIASDNEQADSQNLRNALFKILTNPQTTVVFHLLTSMVEIVIQSIKVDK